MKTASVIFLIAAVLIVGTTLSIMNEVCESGYHAWCAPVSTVRHHIKAQTLPAQYQAQG